MASYVSIGDKWVGRTDSRGERNHAAMNDVADYRQRITAALDRIGVGLAQAGGGADAGAATEMAGLRAENAKLAERLMAAEASLEKAARGTAPPAGTAALEKRVADLTRAADTAAAELQRQKRVLVHLAELNRDLREAQARGLADPQLLNRALGVELDALRAARETEAAEMAAILAELAPLVDAAEKESLNA